MRYLALLAMICLSSFVSGQVSGNLYYNRNPQLLTEHSLAAVPNANEITIKATGLLNAKADTFVAYFHVIQVGETAQIVDSIMNSRIDKFEMILNQEKKDSISINTDMISFVPKYDYNVVKKLFTRNYNEIPDGFELQKNLIVSYHNSEELNRIVSAAAKAEIYDLVKVDYFLNDIKSQYERLRAQCIDVMKTKIRSCEMLGIKTDLLRKSFDEDFGAVLPQTRYNTYTAASRPSLQAIKKTDKVISVDLSPSKYYDAVPYSVYDVVVNPVIDEPMVQLSYQVSIKAYLPTPEVTKPIKELMFIGPNGVLQKLENF